MDSSNWPTVRVTSRAGCANKMRVILKVGITGISRYDGLNRLKHRMAADGAPITYNVHLNGAKDTRSCPNAYSENSHCR